MPRLLANKTKRNPKPPCGRRIDYQVPTSPFQKMLDGRAAELGLSVGAIADQVADITGQKFNRGSYWIWTHSTNGYPSPRSATPARLAAIARVLKLDQKKMLQALDASRALYTQREIPVPQPSRDALLTLIEILAADKRRTLNRQWVLNLARRLHAGAIAETAPSARATRKSAPRSST